jgi:hypothetical protein
MSDKPTEVSIPPASPPPISDHLRESGTVPCPVRAAARQEVEAKETPKEAVATLDNTKAVKAMFPNDDAKQNAAYRIMMYFMNIPGYPNVEEADAKQFSPSERKDIESIESIESYVANYKPSVELDKVDAEAKRLEAMGFPNVSIPPKPDPNDR